MVQNAPQVDQGCDGGPVWLLTSILTSHLDVHIRLLLCGWPGRLHVDHDLQHDVLQPGSCLSYIGSLDLVCLDPGHGAVPLRASGILHRREALGPSKLPGQCSVVEASGQALEGEVYSGARRVPLRWVLLFRLVPLVSRSLQ